MDTYYTLILTAILAGLLIFLFRRKTKKIRPPGPRGYPFIGNSFDVDFHNMHFTISEWAKVYGDIFQVKLFGNNFLILNSAEVAREALIKEPHATNFADRMQSYIGKEFFYECSDIAFGYYSTSLLKRRKVGHRILNAYGGGLVKIEQYIIDQLKLEVAKLEGMNGEQFDPSGWVEEFLAIIFSILITGERKDGKSDWIQAVTDYDYNMNEMLKNENLFLFNGFPAVRYLPGRYSEIYRACKASQRKVENQIDIERNKKIEKGMLFLLKEQQRLLQQEERADNWLDDNTIYSLVFDMMLAGILTTKSTILSAIRILLYRQDVQKRLQEEVDTAIGKGRLPTLSDKRNMPFMEAFIFETMRYISQVSLGIPRSVLEDTQFKGFDVDKGTTVLLNIWHIHRNRSAYPEPDQFKPERFLDDEGKLLPVKSEARQHFFIFGVGKRSCIGESFARNRIFLFLSTMMQNFTFVSENDECEMLDPWDMEQKAARLPKPYKCRAIRRHKLLNRLFQRGV